MSDIEATKFYVRHREGYPETEVQDYARRGFWSFGVEVVPFYGFGDIETLTDLGPTVGIAGYVGDVKKGLDVLGKPLPENVDYPEQLRDHLGRAVERSDLETVRRSIRPVFVKPVQHKLFTGFVWDPTDPLSRRRVVTQPDDTEVYISPVRAFISEHRVFVLDGEVLDVRRYKGSWHRAPHKDVVLEAVQRMRGKAPRAYCLDFAIDAHGYTWLVEMNEGYAMGHYGMAPTDYARMLSARWHEMASAAKP